MARNVRIERGYTSVVEDDGVNYREIALTMTEIGFPMNHSSARNYVLRVMRKFAEEIAAEYDVVVDERRLDEITKRPTFQHAVADMLRVIETQRRAHVA